MRLVESSHAGDRAAGRRRTYVTVPVQPKLYHITHVNNLPRIVADGGLWSDSAIAARGGPAENVGMQEIKGRRRALPVTCHPGDHVADYVPFYFSPRSIMLYILHQANHAGLTYRGGQGPIVHLEADLHQTVTWAGDNGRRWAFTLSNAGARYAEFRDRIDQLVEVNWDAVAAAKWSAPTVTEGKQAEFLLHEFFPWHLVQRIGVQTNGMYAQVTQALPSAGHRPALEILPDWYY